MSYKFDTSDAGQYGVFEAIPDGNRVPIVIHTLGGDDPDSKMFLTKQRDGGAARMLVLECVVTGGPWRGRKFTVRPVLLYKGGPQTPNQQQALDIAKALVRALAEVRLGISPTDESPAALRARKEFDLKTLNRLELDVVVGVDKKQENSNYEPGNNIKRVINPYGATVGEKATDESTEQVVTKPAQRVSARKTATAPADEDW